MPRFDLLLCTVDIHTFLDVSELSKYVVIGLFVPEIEIVPVY